MRILIINPNSDINTNEIILSKATEVIKNFNNIEVKVVNVTKSPRLISSNLDYYLALEEMIEFVRMEEYDAYIIACHSDPNVELLREVTDKTVVGIGEASFKLATMFGKSFAVVSPSIKSIPKKRELVRKYHYQDMFLGTEVSKGDSEEELLEASRRALINYNPEAIILGCANYALADGSIEKELRIPVFEGVASAMYLSIGMHNYKSIKNLNSYR